MMWTPEHTVQVSVLSLVLMDSFFGFGSAFIVLFSVTRAPPGKQKGPADLSIERSLWWLASGHSG